MNKNKIITGFTFLLIIILQVIILIPTIILIPESSFASNRIALVIGNKDYKVSPLKNPVNDAKAMARVLRACDFEVIIKTNANHRTMERAIRDFGKKFDKGSTGLFYYAGHGMQVKGRNYLVPIGAQIESQGDVQFETVDAGLVLAKMEDARNSLNIVILDACRNNPFSRGFRSSSPGLARMDAPTGSIVAYATAPGKLAADGEGKNGVYTKYLVQNIQRPGLTIEQVLKNVRISVLAETSREQTPWESSSLAGNFYFTQGKTLEPVKTKPVETRLNETRPVKIRLNESQQPLDINALIAQAESEKIREEKLKKAIQQKIENEKERKQELGQKLEKYNLLVKNYGDKYKHQAWQTICSDFPMLTQGLKTGDTLGLRVKSGLITKPGAIWTEPLTGMKFVWVPKGCFKMGSNSGGSDEKPVHEVCLDGFWMAKYEVTIDQFRKYLMETGNTKGVDFNDNSCPIRQDGSYSLSSNSR